MNLAERRVGGARPAMDGSLRAWPPVVSFTPWSSGLRYRLASNAVCTTRSLTVGMPNGRVTAVAAWGSAPAAPDWAGTSCVCAVPLCNRASHCCRHFGVRGNSDGRESSGHPPPLPRPFCNCCVSMAAFEHGQPQQFAIQTPEPILRLRFGFPIERRFEASELYPGFLSGSPQPSPRPFASPPRIEQASPLGSPLPFDDRADPR
jgi:hypothetical protein